MPRSGASAQAATASAQSAAVVARPAAASTTAGPGWRTRTAARRSPSGAAPAPGFARRDPSSLTCRVRGEAIAGPCSRHTTFRQTHAACAAGRRGGAANSRTANRGTANGGTTAPGARAAGAARASPYHRPAAEAGAPRGPPARVRRARPRARSARRSPSSMPQEDRSCSRVAGDEVLGRPPSRRGAGAGWRGPADLDEGAAGRLCGCRGASPIDSTGKRRRPSPRRPPPTRRGSGT